MKKIIKVVSILVALFMLASLAACGTQQAKTDDGAGKEKTAAETAAATKAEEKKPEKPKLKVILMTGDETRKAINSKYLSADNFKSDLKDIDVEIEESVGGDEYINKMKTYNATGELPDVFFSNGTMMLKPMITGSTVLDLLPYINKDGFAGKYSEKAAIMPFTDGKLYALQAGSDMYFIPRIFYHKDIFTKYNINVPKTFDEFMAVCKTLKSKGVIPWATYGKDGWAVKNYLFQNLVMAENPQVISDLIANKTDFSNPVCMNALTKIQKMAQEGVFQPGVAGTEYGAVQELFTSKKAAMYSMMTWALPDLAKDPEVDFMDFPQINSSVDMSKTLQFWGGPNSGYCVNAKSKAVDAAVKVAEYCTTQEAKFFNVEQKAPTAVDTGIKLEAGSPLMQKNLDNFKSASTKIQTLSLHAFGSKFDPEFGTNAGKLLTGKYAPEEFVKVISKAWEENFK